MTIKRLLEKMTDVDAISADGFSTALYNAARYGCKREVGELLLQKTRRPINSMAGTQLNNPFQLCCRSTAPRFNFPFLRQLLVKGADPTLPNREGLTPLMIASICKAIGPLRILLDHGVSLDTQNVRNGYTALHYAVIGGSLECVIALFEAGADMTVVTFGQQGISSLCGVERKWVIAENLIEKGVSSALDVRSGASLLHFAARAGIKSLMRRILDQINIVDVDIKDVRQNTPLLVAARSGDAESFQLLLDRGASIHATNHHGNVVHHAIYTDSDEIRKLLLNFNLDWHSEGILNFKSKQGLEELSSAVLPLHWAAISENNQAIQFLHTHGFIKNVDIKSSEGRTPLHLAAKFNCHATVVLLLKLGANINEVDGLRKGNALHFAASSNAILSTGSSRQWLRRRSPRE